MIFNPRRVSLLVLAFIFSTPVLAESSGSLSDDFYMPSSTYAPHAWWHWMNGDVNPEEAAADLEWLHATGIGGVQLFDAGMGAPPESPFTFGSAAWKSAVQQSAAKANSLGLDFVITTSPGWSATGGPWVKPQDAMKKWVWSETEIKGGEQIAASLPLPPAVAGPFQDIPVDAIGHASRHIDNYYRDVKVLAYPVKAHESVALQVSGKASLTEQLGDGRFWPATAIDADSNGVVRLQFDAGKNVSVQGVTLGLPGSRGFGTPNPPVATWFVCESEAQTSCTPLAVLNATRSLTRTASFETVTARYFALELSRSTEPGFIDTLSYAQGANKLPFPAHAGAYALSEVQLHVRPIVNAFEEKAGFAAAPRYYPLSVPDTSEAAVQVNDVRDITGFMDEKGTLNWQAPAGQWRIVRLGYSLTGHENGPAQHNATGLETDKFNAEALNRYLDTYLQFYSNENGELFDGITGLLSDSIESGPQNAGTELLDAFAAAMPYDVTPWLPALTGEVISSAAETDRFLWDYRHFLSQTLNTAHYATIAARAEKLGLDYYTEALEDHRPQLGNDIDMRLAGGIPMAAFWYFDPEKSPKPTYIADVKGAASVATLKGEQIVAVEAMTAFGQPWDIGPGELKRAADRALVYGGNRFMLHSSVHQAQGVDGTPGKPMMPLLGHYFNRNSTWAGMAKPWITYLTRAQYLMQQGAPASTFAYFIGEEAPVTSLFGDEQPADDPQHSIPPGASFDYVSAQALDLLTVTKNKTLLTRGGTEYQFIFLGGDASLMTLATLKKLEQLAEQGVTIVGEMPAGSPSLAEDQAAFHSQATALWQRSNVIATNNIQTAMETLRVSPQWQFKASQNDLLVRQRRTDDGDIYFIVNTADTLQQNVFTPARHGKFAYRFDAVNGNITELEQSGRSISLSLPAFGSVFIFITDKPLKNTTPAQQTPLQKHDVQTVWSLTFDSTDESLQKVNLNALTPLNELENKTLQGFSGTSHYETGFAVPESCTTPVGIAVGDAGNIARFTLNGHDTGTLFTPPWQVIAPEAFKRGMNTLRVDVANYWANQLIWQAKNNTVKSGFPSGVYAPDATYRMAGLSGHFSVLCQ